MVESQKKRCLKSVREFQIAKKEARFEKAPIGE